MITYDTFKGAIRIAFAICLLMFVLLGLFPMSPIAAYFISFGLVAAYILLKDAYDHHRWN